MKRIFLVLLFLALIIPDYASATLFGVTDNELVIIDPADPTHISVVGSHGLSSDQYTLQGLAFNPLRDALVGLAYDTDHYQYIVEYDQLTGSATLGTNLGDADVSGWYEALDFVDSLNSLVVSHTTSGAVTTNLYKLNAAHGSIEYLVSTGRDNDVGVYDSIHNE